MALSTIEQVSRDLSKGFDQQKTEMFGRNAKLVLLKESGETVQFEIVATVAKGWYGQFSERFGTTQFNVADMSADFSDSVRNSDHCMVIDSDNATLNNVLFELLDETNPAIGLDAYWKIIAKSMKRLYIAPGEY